MTDSRHSHAPSPRTKGERTAQHRAAPARKVPPAVLAAGRPDLLGAEDVIDLQRTAGNAATADLLAQRSAVADVVARGGDPLPESVRAEMEARMGHDFSDVRIHTDSAAHESATSVQARAYTVGSDIVFQREAFNPTSMAGRTLIAHELTHVVQQRNGPVSGTDTGHGVKVSDPADRFEREAEAAARPAMRPAVPDPATTPGEPATDQPSAVAIQRERVEEEEDDEVGP